jgi:hypothetical protein
MYTKEELDALSGAGAYRSSPVGGGYYDTITLGKDGKFYLAHYSQDKAERQDPTTLGDTFTCTVLKIRRKCVMWINGRKEMESVEYDAEATDVHTTYGPMTEAQAKTRGAKVELHVYMLIDGNITKMQVMGGSLYNPDDTTDMRLYTYLQSLEEGELATITTVVGAKENRYTHEGVEKTNYQMTFKRGTELTDLTPVGDALTRLVAELPENDARDAKWLGRSSTATSTPATQAFDAIPVAPVYPTDEINPDDVAF